MNLPSHGHISCKKCFKHCLSEKTFKPHPLWQVRNDPGSWGSAEPEVLVLGFSKGSTQADIYQTGSFEDVAFGGAARNRLDQLLKKIGLLAETEHVTQHISSPESRFGFGSMVRCSLTRLDRKTGKHSSSGPLVVKSFKEVPQILSNCAEQHLAQLPNSVSLVLLLGLSDKYISGCFDVIRKCHPEVKMLNQVSYGDSQRVFVHVTHPSPANGHFGNWQQGDCKFDAAVEALRGLNNSAFKLPAPKANSILPIVKNAAVVAEECKQAKVSDVKVAEIASSLDSHVETSSCSRANRIPVSTEATFCVPFHQGLKGGKGYVVGPNPVKHNANYFDDYKEALNFLRGVNNAGWRASGTGPGNNNGGARKSINWVNVDDAKKLLAELDNTKRVQLFKSLTDVI